MYFGDLDWRSVGTVGLGDIYSFDNDTGPDEANHARYGIHIYSDQRLPGRGRVDGTRITEIGPRLLSLYGLGS